MTTATNSQLMYSRPFSVLTFIFMGVSSFAQCPFDPTIEGNVLLCNEGDTLTFTTQAYDSYQWLKRQWEPVPPFNPWVAIPGATGQTLTVNGSDDFLFEFKVACTLSGCMEETPVALLDGYAYGLPFMITELTPGTFEQIGLNEFNVCEGATVNLMTGYPLVYGVHTWFRCLPTAIPPDPLDNCILAGLVGDTVVVSENGTYGFYACTEYCPELCEFIGTPAFISLNFGNWSFCANSIAPSPGNVPLAVYPNPTVDFLTVGPITGSPMGDLRILDAAGRVVLERTAHPWSEPIEVSRLSSGTYSIVATVNGKLHRNTMVRP